VETITTAFTAGTSAVPPINLLIAKPTPKIFLPLLDNGNGSVMASFMMDHATAFAGRKMLMARASDSHPNRGMNKIANAFLESDCDVWINIDADIRFRRLDIDKLVAHAERGVSLVYGIYPKKEDVADPCICTFETVAEPDENGLSEVRRAGRGFMMVKREVLEAMKEDNGGPALRYHNHGSDKGGPKIEWDFFPSGCVTGEFSALNAGVDKDGFPIREWISEDWYFCEVARKLGYKTLVDARIALGHIGSKDYRFGIDQVTRLDSDIKSWREIHGWFDYQTFYHEIAEELIAKSGTNGKAVFVEVGCWLGRSIAAMHDYLQKTQYNIQRLAHNVDLHVVDTFAGESGNAHHGAILEAHGGSVEKPFRANMAALGIEVNVHAKPSIEAALEFEAGSLDAVFIDGDHHYEAVLMDIKAWLPLVKPGGILAGHDIDEAGVLKAVKEVFGDKWNTRGRCWLVRI
jgi:hypothetical protein